VKILSEDILGWGTLAIAAYAALLSTFNFVYTKYRDKPKVVLTPVIARLRNGKCRLAFCVENQGLVDTTIRQLGFTRWWTSQRTIFHPSPPLGLRLPIPLPAGTNVTIYVPASTLKDAASKRIRNAYLLTGHGSTVKCRNGALSLYIQNPPDTATDEEIENASHEWGHIIASPHGLPKGALPGEQ
jgi:hypothetical protein